MAEFIDIIAQVNLEVTGDGDLNKSLSTANKQADALNAQISELKKQIAQTDDRAKKSVLQQELKKATTQATALKTETQRINTELRKTDTEAKKAGGSFTKLGGIVGGALAGFSVLQIGQEIINVTSQFQKFEAVLTNLTGDNGEAKRLIETFSQFAAETPFQVEEVVGAYVKLRNTGIIPTIDEVRKLGDVASASGKDLNQLVEALIDAQVGENERLKEFGIRAERAGAVTRFTFRGITTEVKNTSEAINAYVVGLGDLEGVSGSNAAIAATLGGQISNLKDSFALLFKEIGDNGAPVLSDIITLLSRAVSGFGSLIKSVNGYLDSVNEAKKITGAGKLDFIKDFLPPGASEVAGLILDNAGIEKQFEFVKSLIDKEGEIVNLSGNELLAQIKLLQGQTSEALKNGLITPEVAAQLFKRYEALLSSQFKAVVPKVEKGATDAEKKAADKRNEAIKDITQDLADALLDQEAKLREARVKGAEETLETIRQLSELDKQEALRAIDDRERAITEKLNGSVPAAITAQLNALRTGIQRQFELSLEQDIAKFKEKQTQAIIEFENERLAAKAKVKAETAIAIAEQNLAFIEEAQTLNDELIAANEVSINEALLGAETLYQKGLITQQQYEQLKTDATREGTRNRIALLIEELNVEKGIIEAKGGEGASKRIGEINVAISELNLQSAQLGTTAETNKKKESELFDTIKAGYTGVLSLVQQVNSAIVANETAKINTLIALQQKRVDEINRIADEGNAEALEREQARLETLLIQREEAAQRQQRLSLILQASNFALAASEAVVAITKTSAESGVLTPVTVPLIAAALAAGIGFILSLVNSTKGTIQAFKEGTPFVQGQGGIDNVPAMLTRGERVTTVEDNQRYGSIYDYLSNHRPDPKRTMELLKGRNVNYNGLSGSFEANRRIEAERLLGKAVLEKLTFVNGNLELLVTETVKGNKKVSGVKITNPDDIAKSLNNSNKRWAL